MVKENIVSRFPVTKPHLQWDSQPESNWRDWIWQQQHRVRTVHQLKGLLALSASEAQAVRELDGKFKMAITPYYLSLMHPSDPACPIRRQAVPSMDESIVNSHELADPSGEDAMSPVPGVVHRYPDRVLLYTTHHCAVYCRFCTRKRKVSDPASAMKMPDISEGIAYIRNNPAIREVIVSGGDAFSNSDERLHEILSQLRSIDHIEVIRIGSRNLVTLPFRVTENLARMLGEFHPLYVHTHFNHPRECTREALAACERLVSHGIPVNNHTVLLRGVNDCVEVMKELNLKLLMMRVRPYYLYQCDQVFGNSAFRTSIRKGLEIVRGLRGFTSGLAVPHYVVDTEGGGKVPLLPSYCEDDGRGTASITSYNGEKFTYRYPTD